MALRNLVRRAMDRYYVKYIETNSGDPVYHVCFGGLAFSFLVALPEELRHAEHKKNAAAAAGAPH